MDGRLPKLNVVGSIPISRSTLHDPPEHPGKKNAPADSMILHLISGLAFS